jgi:hypothetical protein
MLKLSKYLFRLKRQWNADDTDMIRFSLISLHLGAICPPLEGAGGGLLPSLRIRGLADVAISVFNFITDHTNFHRFKTAVMGLQTRCFVTHQPIDFQY